MTNTIKTIAGVAAVWTLAIGLWTVDAGDAFPTNRLAGLPGYMWTNAGVQLGAGIPYRTTIRSNMTSAHTLSQINAVIAACPSNEVVELAAGNYNLGDGILLIAANGVTVRGATNAAGFPTTFLYNGKLRMKSDLGPAEDWNTEVTAINVSSGLTEGSTSVVLASAPGADFGVGDVFQIDQLDDGTRVKDSSQEFAHRPNRSYQHILHITSKSGTTLNFDPPLLGNYWTNTLDPEAVGWSSLVGSSVSMSGFENISLSNNLSSYAIALGRSHSCWLKNVAVTGWNSGGGAAAIRVMFSTSWTIEDCIIYDGPTVTSSSYDIYPSPASYGLIQNNLFTNTGLGIPMISAVGIVIAYNAGLPDYRYSPSTWLPQYFFPHGGHSHHVLYEGNWLAPSIYVDDTFGGNNSAIGIIRNRIQGFYTGRTSNLKAIVLLDDMDTFTILGNCVGVKGVQGSYAAIVEIDPSCTGTILTNNFNTFNGGIPSGEALGANTMRDSYYLTEKPAWFGNLAWPAFGPSTAYTNNNSFTNIPAGYRFANGAWPPAASTAPQNTLRATANSARATVLR